MSNNNEKDVDKILGMNRTMFFVIVILLCILSLSIGIYAQVFYRYSDTDPFMLGIGVGKTQDATEITKLKSDFNNIFTNDISGQASSNNIKKVNSDKQLVWTYNDTTEKEEEKYNISAKIPKININAIEAEKINAQIEQDYVEKIQTIMNSAQEYTDYSVVYKAYLNGDLLSLIIKETIHEGQTTQSAKIKTYNYNLNNNTQVGIEEIIKAKELDEKNIQKEINAEIERLNKKDEGLKHLDIKLRDTSNPMYEVKNTENFIVNPEGYLYIIYAYGNTENTNKIDLVIFE